MRSLALLLVAALAGCASPFAGEPAAVASWETERAVFFHSTMTLAREPEPALHAVAARPFVQAWAAGDDYPTWLLDPLGRDALVTSLNVTLVLRATGPVVESARFPDIMVYAGAGDAWMGYGERRDVSAFVPDQVYELEIEVALPQGGLWLAPDVPLGLKVVPVMLQQEGANVEVLVGGAQPSAATLTVVPTDVPRGAEETGDATGEVVGTVYAGPAAPPTTSHRTPVAIPPQASYLVAWMNTTGSVGVPDIDLSLVGPDGDAIAGSGTPTPREAIRVAAPNLAGPGEYGLVVTTAGAPRAQFRLEWRVGLQ